MYLFRDRALNGRCKDYLEHLKCLCVKFHVILYLLSVFITYEDEKLMDIFLNEFTTLYGCIMIGIFYH